MKITKAQLKQIIKEELSSLTEAHGLEKMNVADFRLWLGSFQGDKDGYEVVFSSADRSEYYRIYDMAFNDADNIADIQIQPYYSEPLDPDEPLTNSPPVGVQE